MNLETAPLVTGEPVDALMLPIACPRCAEPMRWVNGRPPGETGLNLMALLQCDNTPCRPGPPTLRACISCSHSGPCLWFATRSHAC